MRRIFILGSLIKVLDSDDQLLMPLTDKQLKSC
jgi:hypothetical protein